MHVLVEWPLRRQRLQQREGLVGQPVGHQRTGQVVDQAGSDGVQPVAVGRGPVLIEVLGQGLTGPQGESAALVLGRTGRGRPHGRGIEVVDVDGHAPRATEHDDLVVENEVLGAEHPAGRMQRLMEVVGTDRGVGLGPQLLDQHITVDPMAGRERQELDDGPGLSQAPPGRRDDALDAHGEPAQEDDPHGPARVTHPCMLPSRRHAGNQATDKEGWTETQPARLRQLDEDELVDLHTRVRRARTKFVTLHRRESGAQVIEAGARGLVSAGPRRSASKAEIFEDALARVSTSLAKAARHSAAALRTERLAAARASAAPGPDPARAVGGDGAAAAKPRRTPRQPIERKTAAATRSTGARRQAKRDAR